MDSNYSVLVIVIIVINDCVSFWYEVLLGIEEEGIFFLFQCYLVGDVVDSVWQVVCSLLLLVGIVCDCYMLVVYYKNLFVLVLFFMLMYYQDSQV